MISTYFRPLVASTPIDDSAFVYVVDQYNVPKDASDQFLNAFTSQFAAALALGQPVTRVRVSSNIANLMIGREFPSLGPTDDPEKFLNCAADRYNMQVWEDPSLAPDSAYVE